MIKSAVFADNVGFYQGDIVEYIYGKERIESIASQTDLYPERITTGNFLSHVDSLYDLEVIFSCWGMLRLDKSDLERMPNLKAIFYAGGSVQGFAEPFLERGIIVCNAVEANAVSVAEFCLGQILLSAKGAYNNSQLCRKGPWVQSQMPVGKGAYGETVALTGIGAISRYLLQLLKPFNFRKIAISNYLQNQPEEATKLGIEKLVSLEEAFATAYIVSNHLADKPSTQGIITGEHFSSMRQGATFINTGRGAQVRENEMIEVLKERTDITVLLDVQHPEPPLKESELYTLPNVHMTSHIAGATNDEVQRMADYMLDEFSRFKNGEPLCYQIDPNVFASMA